MTRRTVFTIGFLAVTALAVGLELFAALDGDDQTDPWTSLIVTWVPAPVTFVLVTVLLLWLPAHLFAAYAAKHKRIPLLGGNMERIRKAIVAGVLAAVGAAGASLGAEIPQTQAGWVALLSAAVGIGLAAAWATWRVPNAGTAGDPEAIQPIRRNY